jgi:hypothetical protein
MSHKKFLHLGREVAMKKKMPYFVVLIIVVIACGCVCYSLLSSVDHANAAVDLNSIMTKCASGSFDVNCAQSLPDIKSGIQSMFNSKSFSWGDIISILKAVGTLAINLFLVVVNTIAGILKGLLPFLR